MPKDTASEIDLSVAPFAGYGYSKYVTVTPSSAAATFPSASTTRQSFLLPPSVKNLARSELSLFCAGAATGGAVWPVLHVGNLSLIQGCKLFQTQNGSILYEQANVNVMSKFRNRVANSLEEVKRRDKLLPIMALAAAVANLTQANAVSHGGRGGLLFCASGVALAPTSLQSTNINGIPGAAPVTATLGSPNPQAQMCFAWAESDGTVVPGVADSCFAFLLDIPLRDLGGVFSVDKYLPYMSELQLDITFGPVNSWTFTSDDNILTTAAASTFAITPSNIQIRVDTASQAVAEQEMAALNSGDIVIPCPVIYETVASAGANQSVTSIPVNVSGFLGSKLRKIFWGVTSTDVSSHLAYNTSNFIVGATQKWESYRTYWNSQPLQDNAINWYEAFAYQKPALHGSSYQSDREFNHVPTLVDDFTGASLFDKDIITADCGLSIAGTNNTYTVNIYRPTAACNAVARTVYVYVECQKDLVLRKTGASLV